MLLSAHMLEQIARMRQEELVREAERNRLARA